MPDGLTPVPVPAGGPSGWAALGLAALVAVVLVGIALVGQRGGGGPGSEAALGVSTGSAPPHEVSTASPRVSPTAPLPPPGIPPPRVAVSIGPVPICPPGSNPDEPGPVDQARPPMSYIAPMAFDPRAGRVILLSGNGPGFAETWTFDICTNRWTSVHATGGPPAWSTLVYDVDSDVMIAFDRLKAWTYDPDANTWTMRAAVPLGQQGYPRPVYDPVSGLVVMARVQAPLETNPSGLWTYDVETDAWTPIAQVGPSEIGRFTGHAVVAYDGAVDRLVFYEPDVGTWLFDLRSRTWSRSLATTPKVSFGWGPSGGEIAYDERIERTIVASFGRVIAYDAATDRWEILVAGNDPDGSHDFIGPTSRSMPWMVYDPVNERFVVSGGQYRTGEPLTETSSDWVQSDDVLAFDPATREWTVLLAASKIQPPPP